MDHGGDSDLENIVRHIRNDNSTVTRRVARAIFDGITTLKEFPHRGRVGEIAETRELVFAPLLYIAIYHGAQDWR